MWLVSVSTVQNGDFVPTEVWTADDRLKIAEGLINRVLEGRGDPLRERSFRMNITLCRHRVLSDNEKLLLPCDFKAAKAKDIAGGPVATLWHTAAMPNGPSVQPCVSPHRRYIPGLDDPRLWVPQDCGHCDPCLARAAI